ncbi:MAG: ribulose-phosphate 3-epimerase [Acidobacteriaceae bacterium]|nr:ribulose-phosphate 3-epimerase [Acidobacteriaceae bacterium]
MPPRPLLLDVSLWSANLVNIAADVQSVLPFADSFHLDVADGHFAPTLLFFPDLVAAIRRITTKALHVHLMVSDPVALVDSFIEAGADLISVHVEAETASSALKRIAHARRKAGVALLLGSPVDLLRDHLSNIDTVIALGTHVGIKGVDLAPQACGRLRAIRNLIDPNPQIRLYADGGIREHTVPQLRKAGADAIVPGSLIFNSPDRARTYEWLKTL